MHEPPLRDPSQSTLDPVQTAKPHDIKVLSLLSEADCPGAAHLPIRLPPILHFQEEEITTAFTWLRPFHPKGSLATSWWYACIPHGKIVLKKSKEDPSHEGKHDLQWSGDLFRCQKSVCHVDIAAWLGGVYLGPNADLHMEDALSV